MDSLVWSGILLKPLVALVFCTALIPIVLLCRRYVPWLAQPVPLRTRLVVVVVCMAAAIYSASWSA